MSGLELIGGVILILPFLLYGYYRQYARKGRKHRNNKD